MEQNKEVAIVEQSTGLAIRLDNAALAEMSKQRNMLASFVQSQLKEKIDFGIVPGTEKPSLWKPGAEKIANIFQLGSRIHTIDKTVDFKENIAVYSVTVEVFHIPSGRAIAQCEGVCSSQEKKYKERNNYEWDNVQRKKVSKGIVPTPIGDVLNTLSKMAQKRAYVGAVIIATGASDFFTMDMDEEYENDEMTYKPGRDQGAAPEPQKPSGNVSPIKANDSQTFDNFKAPQPAKIIPKDEVPKVDQRKEMGMEINKERARLKWTAAEIGAFIMENFGKPGQELTGEEMEILIKVLKKQETKA